MGKYLILYTKHAIKDARKIKGTKLEQKVLQLINIIQINPFEKPPNYEKLIGNLQGAYSRRINIQHRLVYEVMEEEKTIKILRMWSHYE